MKMKIVRSVVFEEEDQPAIRCIVETCNEARNFFSDESMRQVSWLQSGNALSECQLTMILGVIDEALSRVRAMEPHPFFLEETKKQHVANLWSARSTVANWLMALRRAT